MHGNFDFQKDQALELKRQWQIILSQSSKVAVREAAYILDVSEAELLATQCGEGATRLSPVWDEILVKAASCGKIKFQTQNDFAILETVGKFEPVLFEKNRWKGLDNKVNLYFHLAHWSSGFAIETLRKDRTCEYSFQFFGSDGAPVCKAFLLEENVRDVFRSIANHVKHENQSPVELVKPFPVNQTRLFWDKADHFAFIEAWNAMKNERDFPQLLKDFNIARIQALHLAEGEMTVRLGRFEFENLLQKVAETKCSLTIRIQNEGAIQSITGNIEPFKINGSWVDIASKNFDIRINRKGIAEAWRVRKSVGSHPVTSLELYDNQGYPIVAFLDDLSNCEKESPAWVKIIKSLRNENLENSMSGLGWEVSQSFSISRGVFP